MDVHAILDIIIIHVKPVHGRKSRFHVACEFASEWREIKVETMLFKVQATTIAKTCDNIRSDKTKSFKARLKQFAIIFKNCRKLVKNFTRTNCTVTYLQIWKVLLCMYRIG